MERKVEDFKSSYDLDELKKKRNEYDKRRRNKSKDRSSTPHLMMILKDAQSKCDRFRRLQKKLDDLREDIRILENGCMNFHRRDPQGDNVSATPYPLIFRRHAENLLIKRRLFRFVQVNDASEDMVTLCLECSEFLTNQDNKIGKSFQNMWPSFVWKLLTDQDILDVYGESIW